MDLERERGITIKAQAVRLSYSGDSAEYELNLIDTPGHVDFNYEVSRTLAACEGAVLLVDASQGVEAQTIGNLHLARDNRLAIIPVVNKIDLPSAEPERVRDEIVEILDIDPAEVLFCSSKTTTRSDSPVVSLLDTPTSIARACMPLKRFVCSRNHVAKDGDTANSSARRKSMSLSYLRATVILTS